MGITINHAAIQGLATTLTSGTLVSDARIHLGMDQINRFRGYNIGENIVLANSPDQTILGIRGTKAYQLKAVPEKKIDISKGPIAGTPENRIRRFALMHRQGPIVFDDNMNEISISKAPADLGLADQTLISGGLTAIKIPANELTNILMVWSLSAGIYAPPANFILNSDGDINKKITGHLIPSTHDTPAYAVVISQVVGAKIYPENIQVFAYKTNGEWQKTPVTPFRSANNTISIGLGMTKGGAAKISFELSENDGSLISADRYLGSVNNITHVDADILTTLGILQEE